MNDIPIWSLVPFILILSSIAILPLSFPHFWESNRNKLIISGGLSLPIVIFLISNNLTDELSHAVIWDYVPFVILLGGLFTVTGGISIRGNIQAFTTINAAFIAIGCILASFMGTTGAAMLLIRTLIQTNSERQFKTHTIVFFIIAVANCGGLLTPLGDPPLFILYLKGVEFSWFFNLLPEWLFVNTLIILLYLVVDTYYYRKETITSTTLDKLQVQDIRVNGSLNFVWLLGIILAVAFINPQFFPFLNEVPILKFSREGVIVLCAVLSLVKTPKEYRAANKFNWHPILEVAVLFIGIFITMVPCILYLQHHASSIGLSSAKAFFFLTGGLSAFLDNAPTALTFFSIAQSLPIEEGTKLVGGIPEIILRAIALGSVFFGAMSYIGNGPNFMVKSVAEQCKVKMPSFFGYMFRYALPILLPIYILTEIIFL